MDVDSRRLDYRDDDRRGERYDDPRGRVDIRDYPSSTRALDVRLPDTRAARPPSPPRSLAERMGVDLRDSRPPVPGADTYRPRDSYDSPRDLRPSDREPLRDRIYAPAPPPSPPRRAPSPTPSARRDWDYKPRSYEWSRDELAAYAAWSEDAKRREYEKDRAPEPVRRDDYDRRTASYTAPTSSLRSDSRDWPPAASNGSTSDYRSLESKAPIYSSSYSAADRYVPPPPPPVPVGPLPTSRVRPRSPSPAAAPPIAPRTNFVGFIPPSKPSHPESEVARNAKRARMMEALQTGRPEPTTSSNSSSSTTAPPAPPARQTPDYHPPPRPAQSTYDDRDRRDRDLPPRRALSQRSSSPMRDVEFGAPRSRSPPRPAYRSSDNYPRSRSPPRYSNWDRGSRFSSQRT